MRGRALLAGMLVAAAAATAAGSAPAAEEAAGSASFVLERIELEGDPIGDREGLAAFFPFAPGDSLPPGAPERAAARLRERLVASGWWGARVEASREGGLVRLRVEAGEPVLVGRIDVHGNVLLAREEILSRLELRPGRPFDEGTFRADVARILRAYSERGRPLARVYPSRFRRTREGRLAYTLRIGEGPAARIESVRVFGASSTSEAVVARIGGVRPGDAWDVRKIERMAARLRREGLFESVGEPRVVRGGRDDRLGVEIEVEEGPSNSLAAVLGYNPKPGGGGEVVGLADLRLRNILGTARRASFRFERQAAGVQDLAFRYREPWLLGTPISLEVGAAQALRDTLYSRTDLEAALSAPIGDRSRARVAAERRRSSFEDASGASVTETAAGGSVAIEFEGRDRRINPSRGAAGRLLVGARRTEADEVRSRAEADAAVLVPIGRGWVLSEEAGVRVAASSAGPVPLFEQYYLGGTNTVRGYREEQFHGDRVWWIRSELRYRLSVRSRAYLFADAGGWRFRGSGGSPGDSDVVAGGGVGVSLPTRRSGLVRFEIALGRGDGFSDAKVHASLEQEF